MEIISPTIKAISNNINDKVINDFWEEIAQNGSPLIEDINIKEKKLVTFLYKEIEPVDNVVVILGPAGLDFKRNKMTHLDSTNIWFRSYLVSEDAKFQYAISPNDPLTYPVDILPKYEKMAEREACFKIDPLNKHPYPSKSPVVSTVGLTLDDLDFNNRSTTGTYKEYTVKSNRLNNQRTVGVYIPKNINLSTDVSILTVLDGELNPNYIPVLNLIDELIELKQIEPIIVALVGNTNARETEMGCNIQFSNFLADELIPYLTEKTNLSIVGEHCICGFSFGGLCALYTSVNRTDVFKNVIMVSSPLYWSPKDFTQSEYLSWCIANKKKSEANIYLEYGKMENHSEYQQYFGAQAIFSQIVILEISY